MIFMLHFIVLLIVGKSGIFYLMMNKVSPTPSRSSGFEGKLNVQVLYQNTVKQHGSVLNSKANVIYLHSVNPFVHVVAALAFFF